MIKAKIMKLLGLRLNVPEWYLKTFNQMSLFINLQEERFTGEKPHLKKVEDYKIRVNQPLSFNGYSLYQVDYKLNELNSMSFSLINKQTNQSFGDISIDLFDPKQKYVLGNGYSVELLSYFPDFELDKKWGADNQIEDS